MNAIRTAATPIQHPRTTPWLVAGLVLAIFAQPTAPTLAAEPPAKATPVDGRRAYGYLKQLCQIGSRTSGTPGMQQQQELLEKHFKGLGAEVEYQRFQANRHPLTGKPVPMANLIVHWHPDTKRRILLCAHYDTLPLPLADPNPEKRQNGLFVGANDGASGTALLMELGHHIGELDLPLGVDFVFFDGEELVYDMDRDPFFLGSDWFARQYRDNPPPHEYEYGVLLDMIGDARLTIFQEAHSRFWKQTRPLVQEIWSTAKRLGVKEFIPRVGYEVRDDHLPLNQIARIPTIDVIDFQYPDRRNSYWHTTRDTPTHCSADSLQKVGWVMLEWLKGKEISD